MKKLLRFLSLSMIITLILSACAQATPTLQTVETQAPEQITLRYQSFSAAQGTIVGELVNEYMTLHPNIKIEIVQVTDETNFQRMLMSTRAGTPPDVYESFNTYECATGGLAYNLDQFIAAEGGTEFTKQYVPSAFGMGTFQNSQFALPWRSGAVVMYINDALLAKAGLEYPADNWTWDTFRDYAIKMTNADQGEYGFAVSGAAGVSWTDWEVVAFMVTAGGRQLENEVPVFNSASGVKALTFINQLMNEDNVMPPGITGIDLMALLHLFGQNKLGMVADGPWFVGFLKSTYPELQFHLQTMPIDTQTGTVAGGSTFIIHPASEHKAEAWEFIKWMTSAAIDQRLAIGLTSIPANLGSMDDPSLTTDPMSIVAVRAAIDPNTLTYNLYPEMNNENQIFRNYLQKVYLGEMTPQAALDQAASEWLVIQQKYFQIP